MRQVLQDGRSFQRRRKKVGRLVEMPQQPVSRRVRFFAVPSSSAGPIPVSSSSINATALATERRSNFRDRGFRSSVGDREVETGRIEASGENSVGTPTARGLLPTCSWANRRAPQAPSHLSGVTTAPGHSSFSWERTFAANAGCFNNTLPASRNSTREFFLTNRRAQ